MFLRSVSTGDERIRWACTLRMSEVTLWAKMFKRIFSPGKFHVRRRALTSEALIFVQRQCVKRQQFESVRKYELTKLYVSGSSSVES